MANGAFLKRLAALVGVGTLLAGLTGFSVAGCAKSGGDTIKIGVPIPLSGSFAVYGEAQKQATELAVKEINDSGGILGKRVEVFYEDDQEDTTQPAIDKVKSLIEKNHVDVIIGMISSASRDAVIPTIYRSKKIFIYPTTYEGGVAAKFKGQGAQYVFTTGPVSEQYIKPVIPWLVKNKGNTFYFLGMDYIYGRGSVANAKQYVAEAGGTTVGEEYPPLGTTDFSAILNRVAAAKPKVLFAVEAGDDLVYLAKQFHEFGLDKQGITLATSELDESYMQALGPDVAAGIVCSYPYFMCVNTPENEKFLESMRAAYGNDVMVSLCHETQYYSIWLYANAVKAAGTTDTDAVVKALEGATFQAPEGPIYIRKADHQAIVNDVICEIVPDTSRPYYQWFRIVEQHQSIEPALQGDIYGQ